MYNKTLFKVSKFPMSINGSMTEKAARLHHDWIG